MKIKDTSYGFAQHGDNFVQIRRLCSTLAELRAQHPTGGMTYLNIKPDTDLQELAEYYCYAFEEGRVRVSVPKEEKEPSWFLAHCVVPGEEEAKCISRYFGMLGVNADFLEYFGACSICGAAESVNIRKAVGSCATSTRSNGRVDMAYSAVGWKRTRKSGRRTGNRSRIIVT
jgi:hypothetical protein